MSFALPTLLCEAARPLSPARQNCCSLGALFHSRYHRVKACRDVAVQRPNAPLLGLTGPRSDQAWRRGSSPSLTPTCYDLWTASKKGPWLDLSRQSPLEKLPLVWLLLPGTGRAGSGCTQAGESSGKRQCAGGGGGGGGGDALIVMLQVQMALCFMCGLNGLCQPSDWGGRIIWRDHTKTLSTEIQRFVNKGHFHDSKCLLDGPGSRSHHQEDKSLAGNTETAE